MLYWLKPINKNFRPVNNLQVDTSKITEKFVAIQLQDHMTANNYFNHLQNSHIINLIRNYSDI